MSERPTFSQIKPIASLVNFARCHRSTPTLVTVSAGDIALGEILTIIPFSNAVVDHLTFNSGSSLEDPRGCHLRGFPIRRPGCHLVRSTFQEYQVQVRSVTVAGFRLVELSVNGTPVTVPMPPPTKSQPRISWPVEVTTYSRKRVTSSL